MRPPSHTGGGRFVKELASVKRKVQEAETHDDDEAALGMAHMMAALAACVSGLHERKHEALIREVLSTNLWQCPQVRSASASHCVRWRAARHRAVVPPRHCVSWLHTWSLCCSSPAP